MKELSLAIILALVALALIVSCANSAVLGVQVLGLICVMLEFARVGMKAED